MDKQEAEKQLLALCYDPEAFAVLLRVNFIFDEEKFKQLEKAIEAVIEFNQGEKFVSREVAASIVFDALALADAAREFSKRDHPETAKVIEAHGRMHELLLTFFEMI
jgi:hypothetical protein